MEAINHISNDKATLLGSCLRPYVEKSDNYEGISFDQVLKVFIESGFYINWYVGEGHFFCYTSATLTKENLIERLKGVTQKIIIRPKVWNNREYSLEIPLQVLLKIIFKS